MSASRGNPSEPSGVRGPWNGTRALDTGARSVCVPHLALDPRSPVGMEPGARLAKPTKSTKWTKRVWDTLREPGERGWGARWED